MEPGRVAFPDAPAERERHRRRFDVEGLVVLDDADGFEGVDPIRVGLDRLEKHSEAEGSKERARLIEVGSAAEGEGEGFETDRAHREPAHHVIRHQEYRAAVDASREADADRLLDRNRAKPLLDFVGERADVPGADLVRIGRQGPGGGVEIPRVGRSRIGTPDELDLDDVMGRHHARVARVELAREAFLLEEGPDDVDAVGDHERGARRLFRQEIAQRAVERPREPHATAVARDERERAVDLPHRFRRGAADPSACFFDGHVVNAILLRVRQVDDPFDVLFDHCGASSGSPRSYSGAAGRDFAALIV